MLLPDNFQGPDVATFLTTLHLLSLLDILCQLPLDVLQRALTAVARWPENVWELLQGLRACSKSARELCNSCVQDVNVPLPQNSAHSLRTAQQLAQLSQVHSISILGTWQPNERVLRTQLYVPQDVQALHILLGSMQPSVLVRELRLCATVVDSRCMTLIAQKLPNLKSLKLSTCSAGDPDVFSPLCACQHLGSISVSHGMSQKWEEERSFERALASLVSLTQVTRLDWQERIVDLPPLLCISQFTSLRVLEVPCMTRSHNNEGVTNDCLMVAKWLRSLTQLQEIHVASVNTEVLVALNGNTSLTKLQVTHLDIRSPQQAATTAAAAAGVATGAGAAAATAAAMHQAAVQDVSIPSLQELCLHGSQELHEVCVLVAMAPALRRVHWSYGHSSMSWDMASESAAEELSWLDSRLGLFAECPEHVFLQARAWDDATSESDDALSESEDDSNDSDDEVAYWGSPVSESHDRRMKEPELDEQRLAERISSWPDLPACKFLMFNYVSITPVVVAALVQRFPHVKMLHICVRCITQDSLPLLLTWPNIKNIGLRYHTKGLHMEAFKKLCAAKEVTLSAHEW